MLTGIEQRMLDAITSYIDQHGYSPTVEELTGALGYASKSTVHATLSRLQRKGSISWIGGASRTLRVLSTSDCSTSGVLASATSPDGDSQ